MPTGSRAGHSAEAGAACSEPAAAARRGAGGTVSTINNRGMAAQTALERRSTCAIPVRPILASVSGYLDLEGTCHDEARMDSPVSSGIRFGMELS
jgi:hypothetical protein